MALLWSGVGPRSSRQRRRDKGDYENKALTNYANKEAPMTSPPQPPQPDPNPQPAPPQPEPEPEEGEEEEEEPKPAG